MDKVIENINTSLAELQKEAEAAQAIFNKAFPSEEEALTIGKIHPAKVLDVVAAITSFLKRLPANVQSLQLIIPSTDFDNLNASISRVRKYIKALKEGVVSFYGANFENAPSRTGFSFVSVDGQTQRDLRGEFTNVTTEIDKIREFIRNVGLWLTKSSKSDSLTHSIHLLDDERSNYSKANQKIAELQDEHKEKIQELEDLLKKVTGYKASVETASKDAETSLDAITDAEENASGILKNINTQKQNLEKILEEEEELKEQVKNAKEQLEDFDKKLKDNSAAAESYSSQSAELMAALQENLKQLETARMKAEQIIATATSASLAGAFAKEADSRAESAKTYFGIVISSLASISIIGLILLFTHESSLGVVDYIPRVLLMLPLTFIALVANKQLAVNRQAREEYAHKASLSLAFEGYRKLVEDKPTQIKFFNDTVSEIRKNPADKLEKSENEIDTMSRLVKVLNKCPELLKPLVEATMAKSSASNANLVSINDNNTFRRRKTDKIDQTISTPEETGIA